MTVPTSPPVTTARLVLRDGSTAGVRPASPADRGDMRLFFEQLSPASRRLRFMGGAQASDALIDQMCDNSDPSQRLTLVACRRTAETVQLVGIASYFRTTHDRAEVAFAVDDQFHGKGIATALLERLAKVALERGFEWFDASVLSENLDMLDVFRDSGFEVHATDDHGSVEVRLSLAESSTSMAAADQRDRLATLASLQPILRPRAVAIIGASRKESNLGRRVFDRLLAGGFHGEVYPVNPGVEELAGRPCFATARELPPGVDLAVVAVPREAVLAVVDDCAAAGIKGIVVISAGFAESGANGRALELELVEKVRGYGMRMVGPNCMGVLNAQNGVRLNASFAECLPPTGRVALASQSGGLSLAILELAARRRIGLSTFVSLGNKADVSGNDLLIYGEGDPATSVILLYLESFGNPRRFARLARRISARKPIIVVKAGRTPAGTRAAASHTAGLAANEIAVDGLFRQTGVIRADTIDEMFDVAALLDAQPLPQGHRVAILTNAGGPGIMAADACSAAGLIVGELSEATRAALSDCLPEVGAVSNPIDMVASAGPREFRRSLVILLAAEEVDAVIALYTTIDPHQTDEIMAGIQDGIIAGRHVEQANKPVLLCTLAAANTVPLQAGGETVPVYAFPEQAARALAKAVTYAAWRNGPLGTCPVFKDLDVRGARTLCQDIVQARGDTWLTQEELRRLLNAFGLHLAPGVVARTADEAATLARVIGFPVAAKISSARALHKTELGGVRLNLANEQAVRTAFTEMSARVKSTLGEEVEGLLVQPMFTGGVETIVGLTEDPVFGPLVGFGLGGINVELFRDVAFRLAPLTDRDVEDLLHSVRGFALLQGYRGRPPCDIGALRDLLLRISHLGAEVPELLELDLNPVTVLAEGRGFEIVDARARVGPSLKQVRL